MKTTTRMLRAILIFVFLLEGSQTLLAQTSTSPTQTVCVGSLEPYLINPPTTGSTYNWILSGGGTLIPGVTTDSITVDWGVTPGVYTITVVETDANLCDGAPVIVTVTVDPLPTATTATSQTACVGGIIPDLTAVGANVTWYFDAALTSIAGTGNNFATGYTAIGLYTYYVTETLGSCEGPAIPVTLEIYTLPTVTASSNPVSPLCYGDLLTLTGGGTATSYTWDNSVVDNVAFTPAVGTVTYTVTGTDPSTTCSDDAVITVIVNALPTVTASSNPVSPLCDGDLLTLTGGGTATSYTWDNSVVDNVAFTPAVGTVTYTVTGTDASTTCSDDAVITVIVNALPTVTASSNPVSPLCDGDLLTLTGGGTATSYTWDNSVVDNVAFTPVVGTVTYTVTGTDGNGCIDTDMIQVTVNALPTVTASSNPVSPLCDGDLLTLTGGGTATSYTWDNSVVDNVAFTPAVGTVTYTVTGTDPSTTCSDDAVITVIVNALPTVTASSNPVSPLCDGDLLTLTGGGTATSYTWDNSVVDNVAFTPAVGTVTYTVTGTDPSTTCSDDAVITVIVNALPTVTASSNPVSPLCDGDLLTLTGGGTATSYTWDNSVVDNVAFTPVVGTVTYTVTGTDGTTTCSNIATIPVTVNALPTTGPIYHN